MLIKVRFKNREISKIFHPAIGKMILGELYKIGEKNGDVWVLRTVNNTLRKYFPELSDGYFYKSYYVFSGDEPKHLSYRRNTYRRVDCEEYCEERCEYNDICVERCVESCEEEGWNPVRKEEIEIKLYWRDKNNNWRIPRGLTYMINRDVNYMAYKIDPDPNHNALRLREYQIEVGRSVFESLYRYGGAIVQIATGGGKSFMSGWLARELIKRGYKVLATSLSVDLVNQLKYFAKRWDTEIYAYTIQTLARRFGIKSEKTGDEEVDEIVESYQGEEIIDDNLFMTLQKERKIAVILDEVHHVPATTVKEVVKRVGDGWALRIGLSATPWRNDGRDMEIWAWVGPVVEPRISSSYLIKYGYAVPVEIHMIKLQHPCVDRDMPYIQMRNQLARCDERNKHIVELTKDIPKPTLVLTSLVEHAETLYRLIREKMPRTVIVTGAVTGEKRWKIFEMVKENKIDVLVATNIANEGLDLPPLRSMINTLGGKSKTLTLQRVGRIVRPWQNKDIAVVYDLCDSVKYFNKHCIERMRLYNTEPMWKIIRQ